MNEAVAVLGAVFAICMIGLAFALFKKGARDYEPSVMRPPYWPSNGD
jgi:hypothetical protein